MGVYNSPLAYGIKELAKEHKLSQKEVAKRLDMRPSTVSAWFKGVSTPNPKTLCRLAELFGVEIEDLYREPPLINESFQQGIKQGINVSKQMLSLYTEGASNREIADVLLLDEETAGDFRGFIEEKTMSLPPIYRKLESCRDMCYAFMKTITLDELRMCNGRKVHCDDFLLLLMHNMVLDVHVMGKEEFQGTECYLVDLELAAGCDKIQVYVPAPLTKNIIG